jgi:hypothetical protein
MVMIASLLLKNQNKYAMLEIKEMNMKHINHNFLTPIIDLKNRMLSKIHVLANMENLFLW